MSTTQKWAIAIGVIVWLSLAALIGLVNKPTVTYSAVRSTVAAVAPATEEQIAAAALEQVTATESAAPAAATEAETPAAAATEAPTDAPVTDAAPTATAAVTEAATPAETVTSPADPAPAVETAPAAAADTAPSAATAPTLDPALVAVGENVFQKTAGGVGCQLCHGPDAKGLIGPNIVGKTAGDIRYQFENNDQMRFIILTDQEINAVATYLQYLANPDAAAPVAGAAGGQAAGAAAPAQTVADPVLARGQEIFQKTAGGVGCQLCHGPDAKGLIGPNIVGKTAGDIRFQFENNDQMKFIVLNTQEIESVAAYLQYLADPNAPALEAAAGDASAAAATEALAPTDPVVAKGEEVFQVTAGGVGCQICHGPDAKGLIGPNIRGKTADDIRYQFENNSRMRFIVLADEEIEAVATYLQYLVTQP